MTDDYDDDQLTRRRWLLECALEDGLETGASWPEAIEAIASTAIEHPEWDMDETMSRRAWREREH